MSVVTTDQRCRILARYNFAAHRPISTFEDPKLLHRWIARVLHDRRGRLAECIRSVDFDLLETCARAVLAEDVA